MKNLNKFGRTMRIWCLLFLILPFSKNFAQNQPITSLDKIIETNFNVKDFNVWKALYVKDSLSRKQNGIRTVVISSEIDHPMKMMNVGTIADVAKAKAAINNPAFLERIKERGVSNPKSAFYQVIRYNLNSHETRWVVMNHRVKDFDKWLSEYEKGKSMRDNAGLIEVVVARNIDDPSLVQVVSDLTDLEKAKAFMNSKILKSRMAQAGVIGMPEIKYYQEAK